jgi:hypothetical protein
VFLIQERKGLNFGMGEVVGRKDPFIAGPAKRGEAISDPLIISSGLNSFSITASEPYLPRQLFQRHNRRDSIFIKRLAQICQ